MKRARLLGAISDSEAVLANQVRREGVQRMHHSSAGRWSWSRPVPRGEGRSLRCCWSEADAVAAARLVKGTRVLPHRARSLLIEADVDTHVGACHPVTSPGFEAVSGESIVQWSDVLTRCVREGHVHPRDASNAGGLKSDCFFLRVL